MATGGGARAWEFLKRNAGYLLEGIEWRNPVRTWRPNTGGVSFGTSG